MKREEWSSLAARAAAGESRAWEQLYRAAAAVTEAVCQRYALTPEDCEDVTQEVTLSLSGKLDAFSGMENPEGYLRRMAANKCVDKIRDAQKLPVERFGGSGELLSRPDSAPTPENTVADLSPERLIDEFLEELPEEQRVCLTMRYADGLTNRRIAEELNLPIGTVASRIRYAKRSLKQRVTAYERQHRFRGGQRTERPRGAHLPPALLLRL